MKNILAEDPIASAYFAPDATEVLSRDIRPRRPLLGNIRYRLHSAVAHWHAARFERHWRAASKALRGIQARALHDIEAARADPSRPA